MRKKTESSPAVALADTGAVAGTAAFGKFMLVLQHVADASDAVTVASLARATGFPRPTVHRIVAALLLERMLVERQQAGTLALGPRLIQLASRSWGRSELRLAAVDELKRLRDLTGETVHLAVPNGKVGQGSSMVFIEKLESPSAVRMSSRIGTDVAMHATAVGKAYLAALEDDALEAQLAGLALPRFTPHTLTTLPKLRAELQHTRMRGWSVDDEENEAGIHCFAAVVRGSQGTPLAAISVSTLLFRQKAQPEQAYVAPLLEVAAAISQRLVLTPELEAGDIL
ncbi:IclR family transcriptional regulator [Variovorax sp. HJSM1_2]|uniref:IclR family transcriptional regulator n=1 Tax=Variovorax sp. HJSM1_2 TaxID=3366263 RepID=UPI003BC125BB